MKLSIGEEQHCEKCKRAIKASEIKTMVSDLWLCIDCWKRWIDLRGRVLAKALKSFVVGGAA